jgi:hypothetical protein
MAPFMMTRAPFAVFDADSDTAPVDDDSDTLVPPITDSVDDDTELM